MKKSDFVYLQDMMRALKVIETYLNGVSFNEFVKNQMRQDATIRQLEILGEAANKLSVNFKQNNPDFPLRQVISMRNFLIHGYDDLDLEIVWKTLQENIPQLKSSLDKAKSDN